MLPRRTLLAVVAGVLATSAPAPASAPADGSYTAVLDRFETGADGERLAVLLLEADGERVGDLVVAADALPFEGRHQDAVLDVEVRDGELVAATYRPEETQRRAAAAAERFERLSGDGCDEAR